jgi:hypothetical protein
VFVVVVREERGWGEEEGRKKCIPIWVDVWECEAELYGVARPLTLCMEDGPPSSRVSQRRPPTTIEKLPPSNFGASSSNVEIFVLQPPSRHTFCTASKQHFRENKGKGGLAFAPGWEGGERGRGGIRLGFGDY